MKKVMCLIIVVFISLLFSGCASMGGFENKRLVCKEGPAPMDTDGDGVFDCKDKCPNTAKGVSVGAKGCPKDTDGDGVPDYLDECPNTPKGVPVDAKGCPKDTDGDGVPDYLDECPNTPKGAKVNIVGCWILAGVKFDTNKAEIKTGYAAKIDKVVDILNENPDIKIVVQGHTDNIASKEYNQKLSEKRADAVRDYIVKKGIAAGRVSTKGFGFTEPITSNNTIEGRAKNRRVQLMPIK
jgi:OOP family OmpA-OmpF porin